MNPLIQLEKQFQYFLWRLTSLGLSPTAQADLPGEPPGNNTAGDPNENNTK
jgi:phage terminase small subunit